MIFQYPWQLKSGQFLSYYIQVLGEITTEIETEPLQNGTSTLNPHK